MCNLLSFELDQFLSSILVHYQKEALRKNIDLSIMDDMASHVMISGDPGKLQFLLEKVLQNTIDHSGASRISFSSRQLLRSGKEILLEFLLEDNGSLDKIKHKFPYFRSIIHARSLIEELGGKSEWIFSPDHGTTLKFIVRFQWNELQTTTDPFQPNKLLDSKKVLLVEDNEINQRTIIEMLLKENIEFSVASNGKEAIDILEQDHFDMILMDQQLPYMDGFETSKYIRKVMKSHVPIIGMIPGNLPDMLCIESGMDHYIRKPFTQAELLKQMCYLCEEGVRA